MADIDVAKCQGLARRMTKYGDRLAVEEKSMHGGLDAYKRVLDDKNVDVVLFATPPGSVRGTFSTRSMPASMSSLRNRPVWTRPVIRICLAAHEKAIANKTAIVTGTQYRRQTNYIGAVEQIREGAIGDIVSATTRYCSTGIWYRGRPEGMADTEYQIRNWMHFIWLSGDQIAEQAVHNIDALNWVMGSPARDRLRLRRTLHSSRRQRDVGQRRNRLRLSWGKVLSFMCRQIGGTKSDNGNVIYGTKGTAYISAMSGGSRIVDRDGKEVWQMAGSIGDAYRREHKDLIDSVVAGKPIVELKDTADSSLTAVMGRLAAYTGQLVTWDFVTQQSKLDLFPKDLALDNPRPEPQFAIPGKTKLV